MVLLLPDIPFFHYIDEELKRANIPFGFSGCCYISPVEKREKIYVLKAINISWGYWHIDHLNTERKVLNEARELDGITHLVYDYGEINDWSVILKEYMPGLDLSGWALKLNQINPTLKDRLYETVRELHRLGIADLELKKENVVVSMDRLEARIIDLGDCKFRTSIPFSMFERLKDNDLRILEGL